MKNMRYIYIVFLVLVMTHEVGAQKKNDGGAILGFACGFAGTPTKTVQKISKLMKESSYDRIRKKLFKGNLAEQYLAVLVCEELQQQHQIVLTKEEIMQITALYDSDKKVSICSGCTLFRSESMAVLLQPQRMDATSDFGSQARVWVQLTLTKDSYKTN